MPHDSPYNSTSLPLRCKRKLNPEQITIQYWTFTYIAMCW
ncbi:hypothetical protein YPPY16_1797 [Yersinia pestis PY-16]|nr:hypothetical protein YPPY16_1797 [Yersinia pestis PY-16]